jgi:hypothetical protein
MIDVGFSPSGDRVVTLSDTIEIQWNDGSEGALSPQSKAPQAHYHRRFSAQFNKLDCGYCAVILCYNRKTKKLQLVQGSQADVVIPALPTLDSHVPRSWNLSNDGTIIAVGFEDGSIQV